MDLEPVPSGSLYMWMYRQGRHGIGVEQMSEALAGVHVRDKDWANYWRGWYAWELYRTCSYDALAIDGGAPGIKAAQWDKPYSAYRDHPYIGKPNVPDRWVPCNERNKPMIKWGRGCMSLCDARATRNQVYLAENMRATKLIVIDVDGDHGWPETGLDMQAITYFAKYTGVTHTLSKPKLVYDYDGFDVITDLGLATLPASYHLTFEVDKVIPTMHFPEAHIDIVGNERNSLRYWKNKLWNGMQPARMTDEIWSDVMQFVKERQER